MQYTRLKTSVPSWCEVPPLNADLLTQILIDVTRGRLREAFTTNPEEAIASSPITAEQRDYVLNGDIPALWTSGVHPLVLLTFARHCGWSVEQYYECLNKAPSRDRLESQRL
jgi:hypothetical protein